MNTRDPFVPRLWSDDIIYTSLAIEYNEWLSVHFTMNGGPLIVFNRQRSVNYVVQPQYTFPESIRQQTRRRGSIAKVLIYAKLHVKFKVSSLNLQIISHKLGFWL